MCGIVGRAGNLSAADERVFKVMLLLDYFRGQDSTGVASVTKQGFVSTLKMADDPIMLFQNKEYESVVTGAYDAVWIGHNRAATLGGVTRANAHPFTCGHITGVHNGTLTKEGFKELAEFLEDKYDTDSETIYANIAEFGAEETISRLQGAYALVWFNTIDNTLNMIRNDERPLFTCQTKRGTTNLLSWASEFEMIGAAREMAGQKTAETYVTDKDGYCFFPLPTDLLHTWTLDQIIAGDFTAKTKELRGKARPPVTTTFTNNTSNVTNVSTYIPSTYTKIDDHYAISKEEGEEDTEVDLILGEFTQEQWDDIAGYGCSVCSADIDPEEEGLLVCVNEHVILCPKCSETTITTLVNSTRSLMEAAL